uniref:Phospholipid-transporting ATPase n=1 Tax=Strigamia maritima TaxID=126957 RepID=T1J4S5_STRMM
MGIANICNNVRHIAMIKNNSYDLPSPVHSTTSAPNANSSTWRKIFKRRSGQNETHSDKTRTVYIGGRLPPDQEVVIPEKFVNNKIISSKYTILNFIPKNLFEQFRRVANMYFLWVAIIQMAIDSPVSPLTTSMPLAFVVTVTAIKQAYEDWLRHKADREVNCRDTTVVKNGRLEVVRAMDIRVGDVAMVRREESFPCDMILLSSSDKEGKCHVTTANLDGETNLKIHTSISQTKMYTSAEQFENLVGKIECEQPNPDLYTFLGRITICMANGQKYVRPLSVKSLLLKGARLKNTAHIYGCAIYTGQETKMALNSRLKSNKFSTIEKSMNIFLAVFLVILVLEVVLCTALRYTGPNAKISTEWYINYGFQFSAKDLFQTGLSFLVLLNYIIPISLYVTIECQKFIGSLFLQWDEKLYDPETNQCAKCNTSDLNEELGQVNYLFTDKTGTLTENDMQFRQCSISGVRYQEHNGQLCFVPDRPFARPPSVKNYTNEMELFLLVLAICHTVHVNMVPATDKDNRRSDAVLGPIPEYHASSPDEKALVEACAKFGVVFKGIKNDKYVINFQGKVRSYKCLQVLEFTSNRRSMSVIVKDEHDKIYLFTKGAESTLLKKCSSGPVLKSMQHVNDYAMLGLRTLVIACKILTVEEYVTIDRILLEARNSISNREEKAARVFGYIEQNLQLLGAVGVEDRLQDGVPETLQMLQLAGMKIWVLTGDKLETAVNISYSCGHFKRCMTQFSVIDQKSVEECEVALMDVRKRVYEDPMQNFGLIIDGASVVFALEPGCVEIFVEVSCRCEAVVCCRMSPLQKAEIVKMIKSYAPGKPITAAIGDGANDCSMIQEAHVGLGIMGKEGRQAMRCSDFAFARFKFLQRIFLVHGHYYYVRVSTLVQYFFIRYR